MVANLGLNRLVGWQNKNTRDSIIETISPDLIKTPNSKHKLLGLHN